MTRLNHSATLSVGGAVAGSWGATIGAVRNGTDKIKKSIAGLKEEQRGVAESLLAAKSAAERFGVEGSKSVSWLAQHHKRLKGQQEAVASELKRAQRAAARLGKDGSADVTRLLAKSTELEHEERRVAQRLDDARKAAARLGVEGSKDVAKLRAEHERLGKVLDREGRRLSNAKAWEKLGVGGRIKDSVVGAAKGVGGALMTVGRTALYAGTALTATAAAGVGWFTKSAIEATAEMERMQTALVTLEGGNAKAAESMKWIAKFAAQTPYELGEVGDAFSRLRAYGIDPTNGMLKTLGDTSASMGKPLMSAVEAMADAVTGQNERLKEFGIRSETAGNKITYFYKNAAGEDAKKTVKKNSQAMIAATLSAIWNEKYAGSMERQSKTWNGMMSNLKDQWTQFQVRVMQSGVFDSLKEQLGGFLDQIGTWAEDGTLQRWANEIAGAYKWAFGQIREGFGWVRANWPEIKKSFLEFWGSASKVARTLYDVGRWAVDAAGGAQNLGKGLALLGAAKVLSPLWGLVSVGGSIVGWLYKASGLSGFLASNLSKAGGALGGAAKGAAARGATMAGGAASGAWGWLGGAASGLLAKGATAVGAASSGAIAGTVAAGAALGAGAGYAINAGTEWATGKTLSDHIAGGLYSLTDEGKRRAELIAQSSKPAPVQHVTQTDARQYTVHVEAKGADAKEVVREVRRELDADARGHSLASHH